MIEHVGTEYVNDKIQFSFYEINGMPKIWLRVGVGVLEIYPEDVTPLKEAFIFMEEQLKDDEDD